MRGRMLNAMLLSRDTPLFRTLKDKHNKLEGRTREAIGDKSRLDYSDSLELLVVRLVADSVG